MRYALIIVFTALFVFLAGEYVTSHPTPHHEPPTPSQWCLYAEYETRKDWQVASPPDQSLVSFNGRKVIVEVPCGTI